MSSTAEVRDGEATAAWEHPFAELRAAVQRKPSVWLERLHASAGPADPLLVARIPAMHRKLTAAGVPHVLPLLDVEQGGDRLVLVHRHERGESLAQRLARGPLPLERALELLREICRSIAAAHGVGIEHRLLGPASVLLGERDDELWITDFGLADLVADGAQGTAAGLEPREVALHPMTPERAAGADGSSSEDVYLIGCLAHWMISGLPPFAAADLAELARRHANEPPPALRESVTGALPFSLIDAVARALHKDPEQRYPDVDALARVFAQAQREAGVAREDVPRPVELAPRQTNPFGTDPPRPSARPPTRTASLRLERLAPTMVITEADRAALPPMPRGAEARDVTTPLPVVGHIGARAWIAAGVLGLVIALVVVLWPVEPAPRQWDASAGRRGAEQPVRAAAALPTRAASNVVEPMPVASEAAPVTTADARPQSEPQVPIAAMVPLPVVTPVVAAVAPAPVAAPALAARERAPTEPARAHRSEAPATTPAYASSECESVREAASAARESYDWKALLAASTRASCWRTRSDAQHLRVKALMELGEFAECASAVERIDTRDAELTRVGELCRRRASGPG